MNAPGGRIPKDLTEAAQMLSWLEEQRRIDHEELARLAQLGGSQVVVVKDLTAQIASLREALQSQQTRFSQLQTYQESVKQARDEVTLLRGQLVESVGAVERQVSLSQQGSTRQSTAAVEMEQSVREINGRLEAAAAKLAVLGRDSSAAILGISEADRRLESAVSRLDTLAQRLQLVEEHGRRSDGRVAEVERLASRVATPPEDSKVVVDRLAEVLWSKWSADLQSKVQAMMDERSRSLEQYSRQTQRFSTDQQMLQTRINEMAQALEELEREHKRTQLTQKGHQEESLHVRQLLESALKKLEEQSARVRSCEELLREAQGRALALHQALDLERERALELKTGIEGLEPRMLNGLGLVVESNERAKARLDELTERHTELGRTMSLQVEDVRASVARLRQLQERYWQLQMQEMQTFALELKDK